MSDAVLSAIITGGVSLVGIIVSYALATSKFKQELGVKVALIQKDIEGLQKKVDEHNGYAKLFAENVPVIKEQIKVANHRIEDLERKVP